MTPAEHWIQKVLSQRAVLEAEYRKGTLRDARVWRLLVLEGRCIQALGSRLKNYVERSEFEPLTRPEIDSLLERTCIPSNDELLQELEETLRDDTEPFGKLMDSLLEVDDRATVDALAGHSNNGTWVVREAGVLIRRHSERVLSLAPWAQMRLHTVSAVDPSNVLWRGIADMEAQQNQMEAVAHLPRLLARIRAVYASFARHLQALDSSIALFDSFRPPLEAQLGPQETAHEPYSPLGWGELRSISLSPGEEIHIKPPVTSPPSQIRYQHASGEGTLSTSGWRMERGEGSVLLLVLMGSDPTDSLDTALEKAEAVAGLLLIERPQEHLQ